MKKILWSAVTAIVYVLGLAGIVTAKDEPVLKKDRESISTESGKITNLEKHEPRFKAENLEKAEGSKIKFDNLEKKSR